MVRGSERAHHPVGALRHQLAVAGVFLALVLMAGQDADDRFALLTQAAHGAAQRSIFAPRRADRRRQAVRRDQCGEFLEVEAEADCGAIAAEHRADLVVAPAAIASLEPSA